MPDRIENNHVQPQVQAAQMRGADRPTANFEAVRQQQAARADAAAQPEQPRPTQETGPVAPAARALNQQVANDMARPAQIQLAERNQLPERLVQLLNETQGRATIEEQASTRPPVAREAVAETRVQPETRVPEARSVEPVRPSIEPAPVSATPAHVPAPPENTTEAPDTPPILKI